MLSYYELIERLGPDFERMEPADCRVIVESTIDTIAISILSPTFLLVQINWFAWVEQTFIYRRDNVAAGTWEDAETATLKRLWPIAQPEALLLALPGRTWSAICGARKGLKLPGRWKRWEPCILPTWAEHGFCAADVAIIGRYELPLDCPKLTDISDSTSVEEIQTP